MQSANYAVAVKRCQSYDPQEVYAAIGEQIELLGGVSSFIQSGRRVLIKPNLIVPNAPAIPAQTHPEVIYAVARLATEAGAQVIVGDSPAWSNTEGCLKALGVYERLRELGVQVVQLDEPVRTVIDGVAVGISRKALEADAIINVPKLKSHQQLGATFAFKNMYGCICGLGGKEKAYWHFARGHDKEAFCRMVIGIYQKLSPVLNIIDAVVGMEGQGPINGAAKPVGYLVAGVDPAACERVCCDLVGFEPGQLPLLQAADKMKMGVGLSGEFAVLGDAIVRCEGFEPAVQTPLRFSLPRICRSISKQGWILIKQTLGGRSKKQSDIH